jgi:5-hydroxyisourate hydrolase
MKIKTILFSLFLIFTINQSLMAMENDPFQLSTHILDISKGVGAKDVEVQLFKQVIENKETKWIFVSTAKTDENGRAKSFLPRDSKQNNRGIYKLVFMVAPYLKANKQDMFYPYIDVVFNIADEKHYHVPITLSNFGYSTYKGN